MNKTRPILLSICLLFLATQPAYSFPLLGDEPPAWLTPLLYILSLGSVLLILVSVFALPFIVPRLYAARAQADDSQQGNPKWSRTFWRLFLKALKNFVGGILIISGIAMLVLPGQGLLTLFIGVALVDFPGKKALARKLRNYRLVAKAENYLRRKYDQSQAEQGAKAGGNDGKDNDEDNGR